MKITSGKFEVLDSGTINTSPNDPVLFELAPEFKLLVKFESDGKSEVRLAWAIQGDTLQLTCHNFFLPSGCSPTLIGDLEKSNIFFGFHAITNTDKSRVIQYTFYKERVTDAK